MTDKTQNPAEIFLVEVFDGEDYSNVWCDTPAPGEGMREEYATRYVREDLVPASNEELAKRIVELTNERDALAAKVNQLRNGVFHFNRTHGDLNPLLKAVADTPAQCLAEVKAQAVEAEYKDLLHVVANQYNGNDATTWSLGANHVFKLFGREIWKRCEKLRQSSKPSGTWLKDSNTHCNTKAANNCLHNWVSAKNDIVTGGSICTKCYALDAREPIELCQSAKAGG